MSILKRQVNSTSDFASIFIVMTHNPFVNFKLIHFLLWIKESHQRLNFETFECSVFLQVLHHSSVSCKITPLYFFRSIIIQFVQKKSIEVFFNCYLAAPRPTLGHSQGGNLTNSMLITACYLYQPKVYRESRSKVGSLTPAERLAGFESGKFFRFLSVPVKIRQIPPVNLETTSHFLLKFCIIIHCHYT